MRHLGHAQPLSQQQLLGLEQAQALEVLHRRQQGAALEMLVEGRGAHVGAAGQGLDVQRLGVVLVQVIERSRNPGELPLLLHQRPQRIGLGPAQSGKEQLAHP